MSTFANSEDPNEMQHDAAFHQCPLFVKLIKIFRQKNTFLKKIYKKLTPLDMHNGLT